MPLRSKAQLVRLATSASSHSSGEAPPPRASARPGPMRPFPSMPGLRRRQATRHAGSPQVSSCPCVRRRGSAAKRPIVPSVAVVESFEGERILDEAVEILREVPGKRVLGRAFPQLLPRRRGHRVPRRSPNRPRLPPAMRTDAKTVRDDANQRPERCRKLAPLTAPRLWEKCVPVLRE